MSIVTPRTVTPATAPTSGASWAAGKPPKPMYGKRMLLHARRQRAIHDRPFTICGTRDGDTQVLRSKDGAVAFVLRSASAGVLVERVEHGSQGAWLMQTMLFTDYDSYNRWCDADPVRFDEPVLYHRLLREGHARSGGR
jgi:hypothetical protein